ncbi:MAG: asparagine synthase (glutamine-hydrolyzing) [Bacteroidota bacterium]
MCGIAGYTCDFKETASVSVLERMTERMQHRGPDAAGHFVEKGIALGHRRLSIIDLSDAATQPMHDKSGRYTIIYNGEVYNYQEIRVELALSETQSQSDTDVILAAYAAWGPDCLKKMNGMFAFAIWDKVEHELFIARDRLGIKPIYYSIQNNQLIFASEIRSLLASEMVPALLNHKALPEYLKYYSVNSPNTLLKDVYMLPAASFGIWKHQELKLEQYWDLAENRNLPEYVDQNEVKEHLYQRLRAAVSKRKIADVPLGAFLSGGIDSSAVVGLLAESSEQPIHTFSIVFDEKQYDESYYASLIAKKFKTEHHPIKLKPEDFLTELPEALDAMDHPSGDGLNSYVVSKATKNEGFTVALSGLGGDELFAGYPVFKRYQKLKRLGMYAVPHMIRSGIGAGISSLYNSHKSARLQEILAIEKPDFSELYPIFRKIHDDKEIDGILKDAQKENSTLATFLKETSLQKVERLPLFSQVSVGEMMTYTQNVLLRDTDQMSMASSLEVRVPFFDHELVEYALAVPDKLKEPDYPKKLLVESLGSLLPAEVVHRPKMGFVFPWALWIRESMKDFCEQHIQSLASKKFISGEYLLDKWNRFLAGGKREHWMKVWMLVMLNVWLEKNEIEY